MNVITLQGGLGNQMFQYALFLSLSMKSDENVRIDDVSGFHYEKNENVVHRTPQLKTVFGLRYPAYRNPILRFKKGETFAAKAFLRLKHPTLRPYYQRGSGFDPEVYNLKDRQMIGWWQSEKYFSDRELSEEVRRAFACPAHYYESSSFSEKADEIRNEISVAVHIRRTDYLQHPGIYGGICTRQYYGRCIDYILERMPSAVFYLFSDDEPYAEAFSESRGGAERFRTVKGFTDAESFFLMGLSRHHIIANSSYSWWASWLGDAPDQLILAPEIWNNQDKTEDIFTGRMLRFSGL